MRRASASLPIAGLALIASACGQAPMLGAIDASIAHPVDLGLVAPPYPSGPYGNRIGDTLIDITLPGYRLSRENTDPASLPWDPAVAIGELRADTLRRCLVVAFEATWCSGCEAEQGALDRTLELQPGIAVYSILTEGPFGVFPAGRRDVELWTLQFHQSFPVVQGDGAAHALLDPYNPPGQHDGFPFTMVVEPRSMKIVDAYFGGLDGRRDVDALLKCDGAR